MAAAGKRGVQQQPWKRLIDPEDSLTAADGRQDVNRLVLALSSLPLSLIPCLRPARVSSTTNRKKARSLSALLAPAWRLTAAGWRKEAAKVRVLCAPDL